MELPYYKFKVNRNNFPAPSSGNLVPGKLGLVRSDRACVVRIQIDHRCLLFYKTSFSVNTLPIKKAKHNGVFGPGPR